MSLPLPPPAIGRNIRVQPFEDWEQEAFPGDEPLRADVEDEEPQGGDEVELPLTMAQWRVRDLPKPDFLLGRWLSTTSRVLISAPTGLGKSNLVIALGQHIAAGLPFLHWRSGRRAKVLYIDGEMARRLLHERIFAEEARHEGNTDYFHVLSHEDVKSFHPLNTLQGQAFVLALIERLGVELVIFDNIMSLTLGDQTNELVWQQTMPLALTARSVGQVWVHHTGHEEGRSYGTKTREWSLDTVILLEEVKRDDTDVSFSMNFKKARERTPPTRFDFQDVKIALVNDRWEHDVADGAKLRRRNVSPRTQKALDALVNVLAGDQVVTLPDNRRAAHRDHWAAECNARGLIDIEGKPNSARTLVNTFRRDLVAANLIACDGDLQWLLNTRTSKRSRT
jgi:hypothetical protein